MTTAYAIKKSFFFLKLKKINTAHPTRPNFVVHSYAIAARFIYILFFFL